MAIANAKLAYEIYERTIASQRWQKLAAAGANTQRLLWASTGTKDPRYPDTYYVDALIGRDTVDTVPPATLDAFIDHGDPAARLGEDLDGAKRALAEFAALGFDLSRICHGLLADGVTAFSTSMTALLDAIAGRRAALRESASGRQRLALPEGLGAETAAEIARLKQARALGRLWEGDSTPVFGRPGTRALDQEPPRLAAFAGADARASATSSRRSPRRSRRTGSRTSCCWAWAAARCGRRS